MEKTKRTLHSHLCDSRPPKTWRHGKNPRYEVLKSFDAIVTNVANSYRLQEECDVISLRMAKIPGLTGWKTAKSNEMNEVCYAHKKITGTFQRFRSRLAKMERPPSQVQSGL